MYSVLFTMYTVQFKSYISIYNVRHTYVVLHTLHLATLHTTHYIVYPAYYVHIRVVTPNDINHTIVYYKYNGNWPSLPFCYITKQGPGW